MPMKVSELIEQLQQIPDKETRVIIDGYEGGYHDLGSLSYYRLKLNQNDAIYYGPHKYVELGEPFDIIALRLGV